MRAARTWPYAVAMVAVMLAAIGGILIAMGLPDLLDSLWLIATLGILGTLSARYLCDLALARLSRQERMEKAGQVMELDR